MPTLTKSNVRILHCKEYPEIVGNFAELKGATVENKFQVDFSPAFQRGDLIVRSLSFGANEIEFLED